ncbi:caspase family protein [Leptolyngbya sp. AN03gr2]|uniref:caspase family protein n=1 Tax=unclassified Leptolyngbya TaxID=2650499 RepID=UPI003D316295
MKRRYFLQTTALSAVYLAQAEQYRRVFARSGPRKLALLVGINHYLETRDRALSPLNGCQTDVELQRELLIHRFGFKPSDIKILLNQDASRSNILQTFETHLIQQANSDDIVVFHFSGHGSRVFDSEAITSDQTNTAFVPADSNHLNPDRSVNDIMGKTLFLLMSALKTDNVTAVFDCCYSGGGTRGSERVRADANNMLYQPSEAEINYQKDWMRKLELTPEQLRDRRKQGARGVILAAATANQLAKENDFADVSSGLFTYFLTQHLWESAESLTDAEAMIKRSLFTATGFQEPVFDVRPELITKPIYFTPPIHRSAQAVVQSIRQDQAILWLGGLDKRTLESFGTGSTFSTLEGTETVTIVERKGLTAIAKSSSKLRSGTLLKESSRVIPRTIKLRIGLDSSLAGQAPKIESDRIEFILAQNGFYPQFVHYILSRVTSRSLSAPLNSIALFSPSLEMLPDSFGQAEESLLDAIARLTPRFQGLFAAHLIRQTLNPTASQLNIEVLLHRQDQPNQIIAQASTARTSNIRNQPIPLKTPCQFQIKNHDRSPLYLLIALISPSGRFSIVFPNDYISGDLSGEVSAKATRFVPDPDQGETFRIAPPSIGRGEALIVASRNPLTRTYKQLRTLTEESDRMPIAIATQRGIDAIENLLSDLDRQSDHSAYKISTEDVATLSLAFQIIAA